MPENQINKEAIKKAHAILQDARSKIEKTLTGNEHAHLLLGVKSGIEKLTGRLAFLSGVQTEAVKSIDKFPPITEFMGEKIDRPKPIVKEDLSPDEEELALFKEKVANLLSTIDTLAPEAITENYTLPEDQMVVRGVAKELGIPDYQDREINAKFIDDIIAAKKQKQADEEEQKRIEAELEKQEQLLKQKQADEEEVTKKKGK